MRIKITDIPRLLGDWLSPDPVSSVLIHCLNFLTRSVLGLGFHCIIACPFGLFMFRFWFHNLFVHYNEAVIYWAHKAVGCITNYDLPLLIQ